MMTTVALLTALFERDLQGFRREIAAYPSDAALWTTVPGITNSAGTIALHIAGNVQHFVGAQLGKSGYVRDRAHEFAARDVPQATLLAELDRAHTALALGFGRITDADLEAPFPEPLGGVTYQAGVLLASMASHLAYHLGQVNYHRRMVTGIAGDTRLIAIADLGIGVIG